MAADAFAPIDETVRIPAAVKAAAAAAEAYYQAAYQPQTADTSPENPPVQEEQAVETAAESPAEDPEQIPDTPAPTEAVPDNWEHRYKSMEGRYRQQVETNALLSNQISQLSTTVAQLQHPQMQPTNERSFAQQPLVTDEERKAYGDDLLSVVERKALEAVNPYLRRLENDNQLLRQRLQSNEARDTYSVLDAQVPNWKDINVHPEFLSWLNLPEIYSGQVRAGLLKAAFEQGDAPRVLAFFQGFLTDHPELRAQTPRQTPAAQAPKRQAARDLKEFAVPGKARPASGNEPIAVEQPVITQKDIDRFYEAVRKGAYAGRLEQKNADEARIFAAVREGRVRRVK